MHISMMQVLAGLVSASKRFAETRSQLGYGAVSGDWGRPPTSNFAEQNRRVCTTLPCLPVLFPGLYAFHRIDILYPLLRSLVTDGKALLPSVGD